MRHLDYVSPLFEDPGLIPVGIIRSHVVSFIRKCQRLTLPGLQQSGLSVSRQFDLALLDAALRIRRREVDLDDIFAGPFAGVRDLHIHSHSAGVRPEAGDLPVESRVGQAVSEGVLDLVGGKRLKVAVSEVNALFIVDEVLAEDAREGAVVLVVAEVPVRRVIAEVPGDRVRQFSGGVHFAGQYIAQGLGTDLTGEPHHDRRVDGIVLLDPVHLHGVGCVEYNDDMLEVRRDRVDHGALGLVEAKVLFREVREFRTGAAEHDESRV